MNSTQTDRHIIWSDMSLDPDDWKDSYKEFLEINGLDDNPNDENELYKWMVETNADEFRCSAITADYRHCGFRVMVWAEKRLQSD